MSILLIENGYCCGRGEIINRLENWCLANKIPYKKTGVTSDSKAKYGNKEVTLTPNITLKQALIDLGLY